MKAVKQGNRLIVSREPIEMEPDEYSRHMVAELQSYLQKKDASARFQFPATGMPTRGKMLPDGGKMPPNGTSS